MNNNDFNNTYKPKKKQFLKKIEENNSENSNSDNESPFESPFKTTESKLQPSRESIVDYSIKQNTNSKFESKDSEDFENITITQSYKQRKTLSFYNGRPQNEEAIEKITDPFYKCDKLIRKQTTMNNVSNTKGKMNLTQDIQLINTLEIKTFKSMFMTILQIINSIIRYTIVQLPFCIKTLGLVYGPIIIGIIGGMSIYSVYMLIQIKMITKKTSYSDFAYDWWGKKGKVFILILNSLSSFGSCLSYIIIFLKVVPKLIKISVGNSIIGDKTLLSIVLGAWLLYYCYREDLSGIKSAAYWGVLGIIFFLVFEIVDLLYTSWTESMIMDINLNFMTIKFGDNDFISCIACIILSFSFHTYTFSIYECLESPSPTKMLISSSIGIFISTLIYLLVGSIGYILYGDSITDSMLDNKDYSVINMVESICFVINVVMSFPLTFASLRHYFCFLLRITFTSIRDCFKKNNKDSLDATLNESNSNTFHQKIEKNITKDDCNQETKNIETEEEEHNSHMDEYIQIPAYIEYLIIFLIFCSIFYVSNVYQEMKKIFGLLGATTANLFSFILPALFFIKFNNSKRLLCWQNLPSLLLIILGSIGLVVCVISNILSFIHHSDH